MHRIGVWDWKEKPYEELEEILEELGVFMYNTPSQDGSDQYGFIFSDKPLTEEDVERIDNEELGYHEIEEENAED